MRGESVQQYRPGREPETENVDNKDDTVKSRRSTQVSAQVRGRQRKGNATPEAADGPENAHGHR